MKLISRRTQKIIPQITKYYFF